MLLNNKKIIELFNELSAADINSLPALYKIHQTTSFNNSLLQKFKEVLIDNAVIEVECADGLKHYFGDVSHPKNGVDFETSNVHLFLSQLGYPLERQVGANLMLADKYNVEFDNFNTFVSEPGKVYIQKVCSNSKHPKVYEVAAIRVKYLCDTCKLTENAVVGTVSRPEPSGTDKIAVGCEIKENVTNDKSFVDKGKKLIKIAAMKRIANWLANSNGTRRLYVYRGKQMMDKFSDEKGNYSQRSWVTNSLIADSMVVEDGRVIFKMGSQELIINLDSIPNNLVVKKTGKICWEDTESPLRLELYLLTSSDVNTPLDELTYDQVKEVVGLR